MSAESTLALRAAPTPEVAPPGFTVPETDADPDAERADAPLRTATRPVRRRLVWLLTHPGLVLAVLFVALLTLAALAPGLLAPYDPLDAHARDAFLEPGAAHWFGTDENGRDVLSRVIYGVRPSLVMGVAATAIALTFGVGFGLIAGLSHRFVDSLLMRATDVLLAFPDILLALVIITFRSQGTLSAIIAVGVSGIPRYARMVRAQTQSVRSSAYVEAATTLGLRRVTVIFRHVLPNAVKPVLLLAVIGVGGKIGAGATLSFLGLGEPPPAPEWGAMLSVGRNFLSDAWWITAAPATAITLTVISITALGRSIIRINEGKKA